MAEDRKKRLLRQLQEQEEKQKKLKEQLKKLEQKEARKKKQEDEKRWKELGILTDGLLEMQFGKGYFQELGREQIKEYLMEALRVEEAKDEPGRMAHQESGMQEAPNEH